MGPIPAPRGSAPENDGLRAGGRAVVTVRTGPVVDNVRFGRELRKAGKGAVGARVGLGLDILECRVYQTDPKEM